MKASTILLIVLATINAIVHPIAIETLWNWFLVPVTGFKALNFWGAFGLMILFSLFTTQWNKDSVTELPDETILNIRFVKLIFSLLSLGVGWMAHACL